MDQQRQYIIPVAERDQIIGEPIGIYADFDAAQKPGDSPGQAVEWIQILSHAFDTSCKKYFILWLWKQADMGNEIL